MTGKELIAFIVKNNLENKPIEVALDIEGAESLGDLNQTIATLRFPKKGKILDWVYESIYEDEER